MALPDDQRAHAEELLSNHLRARGRNWHPAGYSLILERLDRLVELTEQQLKREDRPHG
ncbi:hypothetical protein [Streptomyces sp. LN500]|uniref:hypothetical protein n=1 Tax=Streptomyces sp. LN500 TaxID=3112978 RepID=UPI00370F9F2D